MREAERVGKNVSAHEGAAHIVGAAHEGAARIVVVASVLMCGEGRGGLLGVVGEYTVASAH